MWRHCCALNYDSKLFFVLCVAKNNVLQQFNLLHVVVLQQWTQKLFSLKLEWQHSNKCKCRQRTIACKYDESVTIKKVWLSDRQTYTGLIESTTTIYRDKEIHPSVKDLQSTTRLAESWKLHIFDTRVDLLVPVHRGGWLFFSYPFLIAVRNPLFYLH